MVCKRDSKKSKELHVMLSTEFNLISRDSVLILQSLFFLINTAIWTVLISLTVNYLKTKFESRGKRTMCDMVKYLPPNLTNF